VSPKLSDLVVFTPQRSFTNRVPDGFYTLDIAAVYAPVTTICAGVVSVYLLKTTYF
jgi:hypothetical protein